MFRAHVLIVRRAKFQCDDTGDCIIQFCPREDEHMCWKHVEAWNKLIIKFSAWSCLILINKYIVYSITLTKLNLTQISECVFVVLCIQHAMRVRRIILSCPPVPLYSTMCHEWHIILLSPRMFQSVRSHSAVVLTLTIDGM